jgi:glycosyltransferase involved in cell wall biosynthesis
MLATIQAEADILVHPSLDESFSMAALEAMALRKPAIAGRRTPGVREVLDFGESGLLVDVRSSRAIAQAMLQLGEDASLRQKIVQKAYTSAYRRFRAEPVLDAYEALYSELEAGCTSTSQPLSAMLARKREAKP